jgi:serine protease
VIRLPTTSRSAAAVATVAGALISLSVVACGPPPPAATPAAPPASVCIASVDDSDVPGTAVTATDPLRASEAAHEIRADVRNGNPYGGNTIPVVTIEATDDGLKIETVDVATEDEAASVARDAAAGGDLVSVEVDSPVRVETNDTYYSEQWAFQETSFQTAWSSTTGTGAVVAVVDTGVQADHLDLKGQVKTGRQFLGNSSDEGKKYCGSDPYGHGTHVAGIVAAKANNNRGVAGMAPGAKILPVRVLDANGIGSASNVAKGIEWAADHGADVINLSLGGSSMSQAQKIAIDHARSLGVVVVAAAGNDGNAADPDPFLYPAAYAPTIAVASVSQVMPGTVGHSGFSTVAPYVDISAPGGGIKSTITFVDASGHVYQRGYGTMSGTSMATPHVSAAAALIKALYPNCSPDNVATALMNSAIDLGSAGVDSFFGAGLVDPSGALAQAATVC